MSERGYMWLLIASGVICAGVGLARPYYEARAFNQCTGGNATYWDALWLELRAIDCKR